MIATKEHEKAVRKIVKQAKKRDCRFLYWKAGRKALLSDTAALFVVNDSAVPAEMRLAGPGTFEKEGSGFRRVSDNNVKIKAVIPAKKDRFPAHMATRKGKRLLIQNESGATSNHGLWNLLTFRNGSKHTIALNGAYVGIIDALYPGANWYGMDDTGPVTVFDDKKLVAVVMPIRE